MTTEKKGGHHEILREGESWTKCRDLQGGAECVKHVWEIKWRHYRKYYLTGNIGKRTTDYSEGGAVINFSLRNL